MLPLCGVEPLTPVLEEADAAGITIVGYSTEVPSGDAAIVYQNVAGAEALADEAIRWYNEDFTGDKENFTWALFTYDQCGTACTDRTDPIRAAIVEATGVEPLEAESVDETSGLEATETFLQQEPDLAMVIGINDAGALGAYQAMQTAIANGRDPETIFVAGMDGQIEALELLAEGGGENGIYRASGALILDDLGRAVADLPADLLEGEDVDGARAAVRDHHARRRRAGAGDRRHLQPVHRRVTGQRRTSTPCHPPRRQPITARC